MKNIIENHLKHVMRIVLLIMLFSGLFHFLTRSHAEDITLPVSGNESAIHEVIPSKSPTPRSKPIPVLLASEKQSSQSEAYYEKLNDILSRIKLQKKEIDEKSNLLKKARTEQEKIEIQNDINEIDHLIKEQEKSFELIQTGGLDLAKIETSQEKTFDWQKDLLEILQPIMNELRQLTEDKRKLINLKNKIEFYQSQIDDSRKALKQMDRINKEGLNKDSLEQFEQVKKKWKNILEDNIHLLGVAQLELDGMLSSQSEKEFSIGDYIKEFAIGRGATILMAVMASLAVYFSLSFLWKGIAWIITRNRDVKLSYFQRIATLVYYSMIVLFSLTTAFYVLNQRNDQVLIGIATLLLIIIVWVLKNSIPRYLNELQTVLNAGSVREGERILYNDVPMRIDSLNFYTKLSNPVLPKLKISLPVAELSGYISRPSIGNEPWFPCQEDDYVMLSDGRYGRVKCITLEHVQLALSDGAMPQTYTMSDFLGTSPKNLSQGFLVASVIGIDYQYQPQCTTKIPDVFQEGIRQGLLQETYGHALKDIRVYFSQANASSLDYKIIAKFDGSVAGDYFSIQRDLQRFAVDVCNQQQWNIPFNQLVIHKES